MTFDARVAHVYEGKRQRDRLEITFLVEQGDGVVQRDGYLWANNTRGELIGSLLQAVAHTQEPVRVTGTDSWWGFKVTWAEKVPVPDDIDSRDKPCACASGPHEACPRHGIAASNARENRYWQRVGGHD